MIGCAESTPRPCTSASRITASGCDFMAAAIMLWSPVIGSSINGSRSSCKPNLSPCTGCTVPVNASTRCSSVHLQPLPTPLCPLLRIGLSAGQSMQKAQPTGPQQMADPNRQLDPHFFPQTLDLVL